jgi:protein SCO1/2
VEGELILYLLCRLIGRNWQRLSYTAASTNPDESSMNPRELPARGGPACVADPPEAKRFQLMLRHPTLSQQKQAIHSPEPPSVATSVLAAFNGQRSAGLTDPLATTPMMHRNCPDAKFCRVARSWSHDMTRVTLRPHRSGLLLLLLVCLVLAHCTKPQFNNIDISGADYARDFALTDSSGVRRTLADYRGKVVVLFFGYTHCPDVCPTTLAQLAQARRQLGTDAGRVQVLFVTLDPERDTPQLMARYVSAFDPSFVGLTGSSAQIEGAAREFKVFFQKVAGSTPDSYTLDHTSGSFVFDSQGHVRLFVRDQASAEQVASDLKRLLS